MTSTSTKRLGLSDDGHHFVDEDGLPFFWLADTAWELLHRLTADEVEHYFAVRRSQGFNVIQTVVLPEADGLRTPNALGQLPLAGDDPCRPNALYFRWVDRVVAMAAEMGLYVALLPTWGDKVHGGMWRAGPVVFDEHNAAVFGRFLGERYAKSANAIWLLGGDRPATGYQAVWSAMATGLRAGYRAADIEPPLIGYHPNGGRGSAEELHDADWLSFNTIQSGHVYTDPPGWKLVAQDRARQPSKPILDSEPCYEEHPIDPFRRAWQPEMGRYRAVDVRAAAYRSVSSGACGHTYGHHSVWQFWQPGREPANHPTPAWQEAIHAEGAGQMTHLHQLMRSRDWPNLTPAPAVLPDIDAGSVAGFYTPDIESNEQATLRASVSMAMAGRRSGGSAGTVVAYVTAGTDSLTVDLPKVPAGWVGWWYDVRHGRSHSVREITIANGGRLTVPIPLGGLDWVIVFDEADGDHAPPGCLFRS